jgi:hypothetical protein
MQAPKEVRHVFAFHFELTAKAANGGRCYRCVYCSTWTQNPETGLEAIAVCPQRDRRLRENRRKRDRRGWDL